MRVRSLTAGIGPGEIFTKGTFQEISMVLHRDREILERAGVEVQTLRVSTDLWRSVQGDGLLSLVLDLEDLAGMNGIDFVSVGPCRDPQQIGMVPEMIEKSSRTCCSAVVATGEGVLPENSLAAARAVRDISRIARDGSKNFMFASIACCPQDIPFFPAAYHSRGPPSITAALENGDLVMRSSERASSLNESGKMLTHLLQNDSEHIIRELEGTPHFKGIDLSLAPALEPACSIALAVENMIGSPFGTTGTLSACSELTRAIDNVEAPRCGYSGLMLPVLEDEGLGRGADKGSYGVQNLLLYSSVCGTGLDAVPVPGSTPVPKLASAILDMSSLSHKWRKPLSARLLPIPDRSVGEMTDLNSPYLRDCSVLEI
ncbi:MAG: DUF711 family protein [Thermoplasmatota archaeon]